MPNNRGMRVLQYECDRIEALNLSDINEIRWLEEMKDLYSDDVHASVIRAHESSIENRSKKLMTYRAKLEEFLISNSPNDPADSCDLLEFLYQEFLRGCLPYLLRSIENTYYNHYNSLLSNGTVLFSYTAKKVAIHYLYHHAVGSIVQEYLLDKQIQELQSLPRNLTDSILVIQDKYNYYRDRLSHCIEIGNKIRELQRT